MTKDKAVQEINVESLDSELAAARKMEENKGTAFGRIAAVFAFSMSLFHILTVFRQLDVIPQRGIHVAFAFTILLLSQPLYEHVFKDRSSPVFGTLLLPLSGVDPGVSGCSGISVLVTVKRRPASPLMLVS